MNFIRLTDPKDIEYHLKGWPFYTAVLDTETTGLDPFKDTIVDIQVGTADQVLIFSGEHAPLLRLLPPTVTIIGHNLKFDLHMLYRAGVDLTQRPFLDTMLMHHLVDENASHALDDIIKERWNDPYKEEFWSAYASYDAAPDSARLEYAGKDVAYTALLHAALQRELQDQGIPMELVSHVHALQKTLLSTEIAGIAIDAEWLLRKGVDLKQRIATLLPAMHSMVDDECALIELEKWGREIAKRSTDRGKAGVKRPQFSFDSSKQLQELLYDKLDLPPQINEKTKQPSVDDAALEILKELHPVVGLLQEYRGVNKVYGTYIEGTLERARDGRIYPSFNVNGTVTGRISHSNPNLGQLPREGGIRGIYIPDPGHVLITADYKSLEIYIAAHFTQDANLCKVVQDGASLHDITAQNLGIERALAKSVNFAEGYGCSSWKLAKLLNVSQKEAEVLHTKYWQTYSGQRALMDECARKVERGEPIVTPWGRKRRFEKLAKRPPWDKAYRQSYNYLIQSTGADCTNKAFYLFSEHLQNNGHGRCWFSIHDEIIAQVKPEHAEEESLNLCRIMTQVGNEIGLTFPLVAEPSSPSTRWMD